MRLVTYNIQYGKGRDGLFDLERIAAELAGADLVALQEVERFWPRSGNVDQATALAERLGFQHWIYGAGVDLFPGPGCAPGQRRQFGNMLLSRRPILMSRNHLLPKYDSVGPVSIQRSALEGVIETDQGLLRVYSVHLTHLCTETRLPQIEALLGIHRAAPREGPAMSGRLLLELGGGCLPALMPREAILMGDFNFEPDSIEYEKIVGPWSVYGGRVTNPEGLVDAWVQSGHEQHDGATSDVAGRPARLDYCFVSTALSELIRDVNVAADATGSDHWPVWLEIDL